MRFEEVTTKIPIHPGEATKDSKEDLRPRLVYQLGYMLAEKMLKAYGEELSVEPSNFEDYFIKGFNDVKLKTQIPIFSHDELAALRVNPNLIEEDIDEGRVVVP